VDGEIVLDGRWRLLASFEAANGIIMFGWTTAIVIAVVQHVYATKGTPAIYTACHKNVPEKGGRQKWCSKKTSRNRNVFLTTTITDLKRAVTRLVYWLSLPELTTRIAIPLITAMALDLSIGGII
jgi:hypothetical protein